MKALRKEIAKLRGRQALEKIVLPADLTRMACDPPPGLEAELPPPPDPPRGQRTGRGKERLSPLLTQVEAQNDEAALAHLRTFVKEEIRSELAGIAKSMQTRRNRKPFADHYRGPLLLPSR